MLIFCLIIDNTNESKLELYSIIAEVDNAGYPLGYCFLSTASSITPSKRACALVSFLDLVKKTYQIEPQFTHVDKDFAEIKALSTVWPSASIRICWWHLKRAISERLVKASLRTTRYDPLKAREEFSFIDINFIPRSQPDPLDNEEFGYDDAEYTPHAKRRTKRSKPLTQLPPPESLMNPNSLPIRIRVPSSFQISQPRREEVGPSDEDSEDGNKSDRHARRIFCSDDFRDGLIKLVEKHLHAHVGIPGESRSTRDGIRWWAVREMWGFCHRNDLPEIWAYMWGNWYRPERWKLWVRSESEQIPCLKTTMICESQ
jgi:hypothetical protein